MGHVEALRRDEPAVDAADGPAPFTQQLLAEPENLRSQIGAIHVDGVEPRIGRQLCHDGSSRPVRHAGALEERRGVLSGGEFLHLVEELAQGHRRIRFLQRAVVVRRRGIRGQVEGVGEVVAAAERHRIQVEPGRLVVEDRRDEQQTVEGDAVAVPQISGDTHAAERAV